MKGLHDRDQQHSMLQDTVPVVACVAVRCCILQTLGHVHLGSADTVGVLHQHHLVRWLQVETALSFAGHALDTQNVIELRMDPSLCIGNNWDVYWNLRGSLLPLPVLGLLLQLLELCKCVTLQ